MVRGAQFRPCGCRVGPLAHVGCYDCYRECTGMTWQNFEQKQLQKLKKAEGSDISAKPRVAERDHLAYIKGLHATNMFY